MGLPSTKWKRWPRLKGTLALLATVLLRSEFLISIIVMLLERCGVFCADPVIKLSV